MTSNVTTPVKLKEDDFLADDEVRPATREEILAHSQLQWNWIALTTATLVLLTAMSLQVLPGGRVAFRWWPDSPLPETCMTKITTGMGCPGCGLTRSFVYLARGDIAQAWAVNRTGVVMFAGLLFQFPYRLFLLRELRQGRLNRRTWPSWLAVGIVGSVIINWAIGQLFF
ncbi:MAG: DUF2752 domain-containing protein [Planctomycetaceae bacterium]|nr:DUF2752 domain-containing protein [Planctomycetaceae bacterium]MCA9042678.1 DUF2752 domain-containing protein [Planctomycetaceae bacterium]MCB9950251.1 DUF2752 domain-containing protein [Planctomycetaceae bacterium]